MLLALIAYGLQQHANLSTVSQLGNRMEYVGMSDIGTMQECPRLAVFRKVHPSHAQEVTLENYESILKKQLTLQRGHWLEDGIANALYANGYQIIPQLELSILVGRDKSIPLKVHFDFVVIGNTAVRILELKSNAKLPSEPSKSYVAQIHGQVSLLYKYWNEAVFNLRDAHGVLLFENKTFPEICKDYLGINLTETKENIDLQGWLLSVSMTEAKAFGPYLTDNSLVRSSIITTQFLWKYVNEYKDNPQKTIPHAKGFCLLCSFCEYIGTCPKFEGVIQPEWEQSLEDLERLKSLRDKTNEDIKDIEENIKQTLFPTEHKGAWIEAGKHRLRVTEQAGRKTFDKKKLFAELEPLLGADETNQLLADCELEGAPFARLYTQTIKN